MTKKYQKVLREGRFMKVEILDAFAETDLRKVAKMYRDSMYGADFADCEGYSFDLGYQWADKKHRHVNQLCRRLEEAADEIDRLKSEIDRLTFQNPSDHQPPDR